MRCVRALCGSYMGLCGLILTQSLNAFIYLLTFYTPFMHLSDRCLAIFTLLYTALHMCVHLTHTSNHPITPYIRPVYALNTPLHTTLPSFVDRTLHDPSGRVGRTRFSLWVKVEEKEERLKPAPCVYASMLYAVRCGVVHGRTAMCTVHVADTSYYLFPSPSSSPSLQVVPSISSERYLPINRRVQGTMRNVFIGLLE